MQFRKDKFSCIRQVLDEIKDQEVTQEVKLTEGQPDIDTVLGAWGQVLIRSKEWEDGYIRISGGIMVWVMYCPQMNHDPVTVENWMPFECKWDIPQQKQEGTFCVSAVLRMLDARNISGRKLMIRAGLGVSVKAMLPCEMEMFVPEEMSDKVQLNMVEKELLMPCECAERAFSLDEELQLPQIAERLVRYQLQPYISEMKVMTDKLVFRGGAALTGVYESENKLRSFSLDIPFAQYASLEKEFDPDAQAWICPIVTGLEVDLQEGNQMRLKAGIVAQYLICDQVRMRLIGDCYSNDHELQIQMGERKLQSVSDQQEMPIYPKCSSDINGQVVDRTFLPDIPRTCRIPEGMDVQLSGKFQTMYYDLDGALQVESGKWEDSVCIPCGEDEHLQLQCVTESQSNDQQMKLHAATVKTDILPVVENIEIGQPKAKNENRPSVILCRVGQDSLWQIAKQTGSTVAHICAANQLEETPDPKQIILIPIV